jgi:hypothetical protein
MASRWGLPGGRSLSVASPKESNKRKGDHRFAGPSVFPALLGGAQGPKALAKAIRRYPYLARGYEKTQFPCALIVSILRPSIAKCQESNQLEKNEHSD